MTDFDSSFDGLVKSLYAAAGDGAAWGATIQRYVEVAGCEAACLFYTPHGKASARIHVSAGIDLAMVRAFDDYYSRINPYAPGLARQEAGSVVTLGALVSRSEERRSEFYNDYVVPMRHHVAPVFAKVLEERDVTAMLGLFSTSYKEGELERVMAFQRRFVGHLQCAFRLHSQIVDLKVQVSDLMAALDYRNVAVLSVDGAARVASVSRRAASILARKDGLTYQSGVFEARLARPVSVARALQMVTGVGREKLRHSPPLLRVARQGHERGYELLICPVLEHQPELYERGARALVFIMDASAPPVLDTQLLIQSHGLTKSEARVVQLLASGESAPSIARRLCVSRETVKSHLSAAYAKTGTRGQSELVAAVLTSIASVPHLPEGSPDAR